MVLTVAGCGKKDTSTSVSTFSEHVSAEQTPTVTEEPKIKVIEGTNLILPEAIAAFEDAGFKNISSNAAEDPEWPEERWIVTEQNVATGDKIKAEDPIVLTCKKMCNLYLDISSKSNLFFDTYDIDIYIDDEKIGTVANGDGFGGMVELMEGSHILTAYNTEDNNVSASQNLDIKGDMSFKCILEHGSEITFHEIEILNEISSGASLEVPDVNGMVLSNAETALSEAGFKNIESFAENDSIWDSSNWIVINQSLQPGDQVDQYELLRLECVKAEVFLGEKYVGLTLLDAEKAAIKDGYTIEFYNEEAYEDITSTIQKETDEKKALWDVKSIDVYDIDKGIIQFNVIYIGTPEEQAAAKAAAEAEAKAQKEAEEKAKKEAEAKAQKESEEKKEALSYTTNDEETAKLGNTGVYAYIMKGQEYDIYYIINFDEGYADYFAEGNGDEEYMRCPIEGDLNSVLIMTYTDGVDVWQEGLHFKYKNQPNHLIVQEQSGAEYDYSTTNLNEALKIRDKKTMFGT